MKRLRIFALFGVLGMAGVCAGVLGTPRTEADFHSVQIEQLMAGAFGDDDIEFIEILIGFRQNCQGGGERTGVDFGCLSPSPTNGAKLVFFDGSGVETGEFLFPDNTPNGESGRSFLVGTQEFADAATIAPDHIMPSPSNIAADSGTVCYRNVPDASFGVNLCIAYGPATANGPLPITGSLSLKRTGGSFDLVTAAPKNNNNEVGALLLPGDLAITKTDGQDPVTVGSNLTYTVTVSNNSPDPATGVVVTDTLPGGVTFVSATPSQGSCSGTTTVTCDLGTMSSGTSATVTIEVTVTAVGNLSNTASVTGNEADPNASNDSATEITTANASPTPTPSPPTATPPPTPTAIPPTATPTPPIVAVISQGVAAMLSDVARTTFGVDGTGVTIGVMSDSFNCLGGEATDVATGDLPLGIVVLDDSACPFGDSDEGRAMMQLIHDVAPGAGQMFHTAILGQANFATGIAELAAAGADVIVDDIIFFAEPMFQDGIISQAVDDVKANGVAYFSSAGNNGRDAYESPYDESPLGPIFEGATSLGVPHDFDPGPGIDEFQRITLPRGSTVLFSLQWDDPFFSVSGSPGAQTDLDIFLLDEPPTQIFLRSDDFNIGNDPVEILGVFNGSNETEFNLLITKFSGPDPGFMKYVVFGPQAFDIGEFDTASGTVYGHANSAGAEAVGAAAFFNTPAFGVSPPVLETFSSSGPTRILFDTSGNPIGPVIRNKPEIVAPDGTNTTFFGSDIGNDADTFPNFFGTSAAAPHAAAVAALMLEADPSLLPDDIYTRLESTAIDMDAPGFDFNSGFGLIQANKAVGGDCTLPGSGDWVVSASCTLQGSATAPANVIVEPGFALIIDASAALDIDFTNFHLLIKNGAKVVIKDGGKIF